VNKFKIAEVECSVGDIIECLGIPFAEHAERYHIVLQDGETRDLGNNNSNMWCFWTPIRNLGHYSQHPDLFDEDDKQYYFGDKEAPKEEK
jgi:hypothetical protein